MPRGDGTGPMGGGPLTGRGFGRCPGAYAPRFGAGLGYGRRRGLGGGFGRFFAMGRFTDETQKDFLEEEREILKRRLELIDKELEDL